MFGLGYGEIFIILLIVIILFGGSRLPELGRSIGEAITGFKKSINDDARSNNNKDHLT